MELEYISMYCTDVHREHGYRVGCLGGILYATVGLFPYCSLQHSPLTPISLLSGYERIYVIGQYRFKGVRVSTIVPGEPVLVQMFMGTWVTALYVIQSKRSDGAIGGAYPP
jgi:hypothetical protein